MPVNPALARMFIQLKISERSGRGVLKIVEALGKEAFEITSNSITVVIPFNKINTDEPIKVTTILNNKVRLNDTHKAIILEMRNNPNITISQIQNKLNQSESSINQNIRFLTQNEVIKRIGSRKQGYWEVIE